MRNKQIYKVRSHRGYASLAIPAKLKEHFENIDYVSMEWDGDRLVVSPLSMEMFL